MFRQISHCRGLRYDIVCDIRMTFYLQNLVVMSRFSCFDLLAIIRSGL